MGLNFCIYNGVDLYYETYYYFYFYLKLLIKIESNDNDGDDNLLTSIMTSNKLLL